MKKSLKRKILFWAIGALCISSTLTLAAYFQLLYSWHVKITDLYYHSKPAEISQDIVIVAIDNKSFAVKNMSELETLQFDKADYAQVINNLLDEGAETIGIDIIFSEKSPVEDQKILAETLKKNENVILAAEPNGLKPLPIFTDTRKNTLGSIHFLPDMDNIIRRQKVFFDDPEAPLSFAMQITNSYFGLIQSDSKKTETGLKMMDFDVRVGQKKYEKTEVPLDEEGNFLIHFFGPPNSFPEISFIDAFQGKMIDRRTENPINLKNKIVLIGEVSSGIHDEQYVPTSFGNPMPGVEIHANTIQTILQQKFTKEQSEHSILVFVLLGTAIFLALFLFFRVTFSLIALVLGFFGYFITSYIAFEMGYLLNTIYIPITLFTCYTTAFVYRYITEQHIVRQTKEAFSKFVSEKLVQEIVENQEELHLGGKKKHLTVFFSDIVGFTTISEKTPATKLLMQLNEYFHEMSEIILEMDGTVDKYIGDAVMAFWGAPVKQEKHALNACLCALKQQEKLKKLQEKWKKEHKSIFKVRMGIHTGDMVVGNIGSERRFDYTVIGDSVNLGSRLEGINKIYGTKILISENTQKLIKKYIETREIDFITVKGKHKPVRIYELLGEKGKISKKQKIIKEIFEKALLEYRKQNFKKAQELFEKLEHDSASKVYQERCKHFIKNPPREKWNEVFVIKEK